MSHMSGVICTFVVVSPCKSTRHRSRGTFVVVSPCKCTRHRSRGRYARSFLGQSISKYRWATPAHVSETNSYILGRKNKHRVATVNCCVNKTFLKASHQNRMACPEAVAHCISYGVDLWKQSCVFHIPLRVVSERKYTENSFIFPHGTILRRGSGVLLSCFHQ